MKSENNENEVLLFENIIYSKVPKTLEIENNYEINLEENPQKTALEILNNAYSILNSPKNKKIEVKKTIKNIDEVIKEIQIQIKSKNFQIVDDTNYEIISIYSQKELLNSIFESINNEDIIKNTEKIHNFFKKYAPELIKDQNKINQNVEKIEKTLQKQRNEISFFKKKTLDLIEKEIKNEEKVLEKLFLEKKEHEKIFHLILDKEENSNYEKKLKEKEKRTFFSIKQLKLDEKLFKAKIATLKNNLKAKKYKTIEPISFICTLGLIYWSSYSNTKQVILRHENKINKIKEKEIKLEKELAFLTQEKTSIQDKNVERLKEITKKEDELQKNIEKLEKEINNKKKNIEKKYENRKKNEKEYEKLIEEENTISKEYILQYDKLKKIHSLTEKKFLELFEKIKIRREIQKQEVKDMILSIEKQQFKYSKNITIPIIKKIQYL